MILTLVAAMAMAMPAMAQGNNQQEPKKFDKTEMIKHHTDMMVKKYSLDDSQAKKLQDLNEKYADKLPLVGGPRPGGPRHGGPGPQAGQKPKERPQIDGATGASPQMQAPDKTKADKKREEMKKNREAYDKSLKKILGDEKYAQYENDRKQMMRRGPKPQKDNAQQGACCGNCNGSEKK